MSIDSIDNNNDDRRADRKRSETRSVEEKKALERSGRDFKAKLESQSKNKEVFDKQQNERFAQKNQESLLDRILQTQRKKEENASQDQKDLNKKEDERKDVKKDARQASQKKNTEGETHKRVESRPSHQEQSDDQNESSFSGGSGGSGESKDGQKDSSGGEGGQKKENQFSSPEEKSSWIGGKQKVQKTTFGFGAGQNTRNFLKEEEMNEIVDQVVVATYHDGNKEVEIVLKDDVFDGLKMKFRKEEEGIVVEFLCPNMTVKSLFILNKAKMFLKLKEKGIHVHQIEIF